MAKVNECLGLSITNSYVRYAKVIKDTNNFLLKEYGVKFVKENLKSTMYEIISETNSKTIPVAVNSPSPQYKNFNLFKHIANLDVGNAIKLEFEDWCEQKNVMPDKYSYISFMSDLAIGDYKSAMIAIEEKEKIQEFSSINDVKVAAMFPSEVLSKNLVNRKNSNYAIVNLDEELAIITVLNNKVNTINHYNIGMKDVFEKFQDVLGNFSKAYEACKQINVFNEDVGNNKIQLEEILEPILQDVLNKASEVIKKYKSDINKIYITGSGVLFTNIDTLFSEYLGIKTELLKPDIVTQQTGVKNIAEIIEVNSAISLAMETLVPTASSIAFFNTHINQFSKFTTILDSLNSKKPKNVVNKEFNIDIKKVDKAIEIAMYPIIVLGIVPIVYFALSNIFVGRVNGVSETIKNKALEYETQAEKISQDVAYITESQESYKKINDNINSLLQKIQNNEIGKLSTYNVASFMQKLIRIMPKDVKLNKVWSDDNKYVKIVAVANEYPAIGYFVAALRNRSDILKEVEITRIANGQTIVVEIGGELP